jgi:hypothetical protein
MKDWKNIKISFVILVYFVCANIAYSQSKIISGKVVDSLDRAIENILVLETNSNIYDYTDEKGNFFLNKNKLTDTLELRLEYFGALIKIIRLSKIEFKNEVPVKIKIQKKFNNLKEVIIQAEKPATIKKDTINFKTRYFTDGTEQSVEDLLKKIPGLQIDSEGTIKIGNQEIEKLMVDGDDLF